MLYEFYGVSLLLFSFAGASSLGVSSLKGMKELDANLPCTKNYCITSCGGSGLEDFQLQMTGFPFLPNSRKTIFNMTFIPSKIITYLVGTGNFSIKSAKYPDMAPVTLFRTLNGCSDSPTSQLQCPLIAGRKVDISQTYNLGGPFDFAFEIGVQLTFVLKAFDQNEDLLICGKGEPV
ncbi:uncharacterized protein LOC134183627 [Corticium candelabrum]|uniref:uncharacterized protein LOC134183627 n=1 Tax=Corticium candelabrum TaxID=121492 RepID=UPI002E255078|nr:uncharacterized protein LOC134183627 [Corticium candelabrum]